MNINPVQNLLSFGWLRIILISLGIVTNLSIATPVFETDFSSTELPEGMNPLFKTRWWVEDGILNGLPATEEQQEKTKLEGPGHFGYNASVEIPGAFEDAVIQFDFKFDDPGCTAVFMCTSPDRSHLFNLNISRDEVSLMRFHDKQKQGDQKEYLKRVPVNLPKGKWYRVKVEIEDIKVTVSVSGRVLFSVAHPRFTGHKHNSRFRTAGPCLIQLDNISINQP